MYKAYNSIVPFPRNKFSIKDPNTIFIYFNENIYLYSNKEVSKGLLMLLFKGKNTIAFLHKEIVNDPFLLKEENKHLKDFKPVFLDPSVYSSEEEFIKDFYSHCENKELHWCFLVVKDGEGLDFDPYLNSIINKKLVYADKKH